MLASEGAVVATYRVVRTHGDRVVFEREGHTFFVRVGAERQDALTPTPTTPYVRKGSAPIRVVAPPANIEEIRQQAGAFVERLKANPAFQERVDTMLRRVREREGASDRRPDLRAPFFRSRASQVSSIRDQRCQDRAFGGRAVDPAERLTRASASCPRRRSP